MGFDIIIEMEFWLKSKIEDYLETEVSVFQKKSRKALFFNAYPPP
jgi:hypothetical protein